LQERDGKNFFFYRSAHTLKIIVSASVQNGYIESGAASYAANDQPKKVWP
jgi:hypothetical protein